MLIPPTQKSRRNVISTSTASRCLQQVNKMSLSFCKAFAREWCRTWMRKKHCLTLTALVIATEERQASHLSAFAYLVGGRGESSLRLGGNCLAFHCAAGLPRCCAIHVDRKANVRSKCTQEDDTGAVYLMIPVYLIYQLHFEASLI